MTTDHVVVASPHLYRKFTSKSALLAVLYNVPLPMVLPLRLSYRRRPKIKGAVITRRLRWMIGEVRHSMFHQGVYGRLDLFQPPWLEVPTFLTWGGGSLNPRRLKHPCWTIIVDRGVQPRSGHSCPSHEFAWWKHNCRVRDSAALGVASSSYARSRSASRWGLACTSTQICSATNLSLHINYKPTNHI